MTSIRHISTGFCRIKSFLRVSSIAMFWLLGMVAPLFAQFDAFDPTWLNPDQEYIKVYTGDADLRNGDLMYQIDVSQLIPQGFPEGSLQPGQLKMYDQGREIYLEIEQQAPGPLVSGDKIRFMGQRRTGKNELWAHRYRPNEQASPEFSSFTDNMIYWLTWTDEADGLRYRRVAASDTRSYYAGARDTTHLELSNSDIGYFLDSDPKSELPLYTAGEGFFWNQLSLTDRNQTEFLLNRGPSNNTKVNVDIPLTGLVLDQSPISLEAHFVSRTVGNRIAQLLVNYDDNGQIGFNPVAEQQWSGKQSRILIGRLSPTDLIQFEDLEVKIRLLNRTANQETGHLVLFDWLRYSYLRDFSFPSNLAQRTFWLRNDGVQSVKLEDVGTPDSIRVYNPGTGRIFLTEVDSEEVSAVFFDPSSTGNPRRYIIVRDGFYAGPIRYERYERKQDLVSPDNRGQFMILTRSVFMEEAQRYADYRQSKSGLSTVVVDADEVWNTFDYGAQRPIAFRRFIHYAIANWEEPPEQVFILADGDFQFRNTPIEQDEIPPFGNPPSDVWFAVNYNGPEDWVPQVGIGRMTVRQPSEITRYLNKVRQYERDPIQLESWQKRIAYLSGGNNAQEQQDLFTLNRFIAESANRSIVGADTVLFRKRTNQPLDGSRRTELRRLINNGTFLLQFFGHTSQNSWDLLTDDPDSYQNVGKYNIVLSLGCYSGGFQSTDQRIISEEFVFAPNAAIAYVGGSGAGRISSLDKYGGRFNRAIFRDTLNVLGSVTSQAVAEMASGGTPVIVDLSVMLNFITLGDPSLELAYPRKPDYTFDTDPLTINPETASISDSLLLLDISLRNLGLRSDDQVRLVVNHTKPGNRFQQLNQLVQSIKVSERVRFEVPIEDQDAGRHTFEFRIDPFQEVEEVSTTNNLYEGRKIVFSTGVDLLSPLENGIIPSRSPSFAVSSPSAGNGVTYLFELDSLPDFTNPLASASIPSRDVVTEWEPGVSLDQNQTYYWRSRIAEGSELNWRRSQFLVDTLRNGIWWQQSLPTFVNNDITPTMRLENESFQFNTAEMDVGTESNTWLHSISNRNFPASTTINGVEFGRLDISFHMIVIDQFTGEILLERSYGIHDGFYQNPNNISSAYNALVRDINAIDPGDYVVMRIRQQNLIETQTAIFRESRALMDALRSIGGFKAGGGIDGTESSRLSSGDGYILFGKKGVVDPSEVSEYVVKSGSMEADTTWTFNESRATMFSPVIGPVSSWDSLRFNSELPNISSSMRVEIRTLENPFGESRFARLFGGFDTENRESIGTINPTQYPYIQLRAIFADPAKQVTPQLLNWQVKYDPLPEVAIDPNLSSSNSDTVENGFPYRFRVALNNIGQLEADTLLMEYVDLYNNQPRPVGVDTIFNLQPGSQQFAEVELDTRNEVGLHELQISISDSFRDRFRYNNFLTRRYLVRNDTTRPSIEVFVDNQFLPPVDNPILDKRDPRLPFLPSQPVFDIYWRDGNPFLTISDSSNVRIELYSDPVDKTVFQPGDPNFSFEPARAKSQRNEAYAQFRPDFTGIRDSVISITVLAQDETGNLSEGQDGYTLSFRVKQDVTVTSLYPYPNPMSSFTHFAFQMSGEDVATVERFKLNLFTMSGRPVRSFDLVNDGGFLDLNDNGQLRIGWNKLRWDGTDQDGNRLANGVYLYTVDLVANGNRVEVNNGEVEKVVIIR